MLRRPTIGAVAVFVLALAVSIPPCAQAGEKPKEKPKEKPYALIYGTVWDPDNHAIYGIKVKIRRADEKKVRWELYSNHSGEFAQRVPPGPADYVVFADVKGVKPSNGKHLQTGTEVTVHIDGDERQDIGLHLTW